MKWRGGRRRTPWMTAATAIALLVVSLPTSPTAVTAWGGAVPVQGADDEFIVRFRDEASLIAAEAALQRAGAAAVERFDSIDALAIAADNPQLAALTRSPKVIDVAPPTIYSLAVDPPWGIDRIDQRSGPIDHSYMKGASGAGVTAYVIDTGLWMTHTQFTGRVPRSFVASDPAVASTGTNDCQGHGTHVAGTLGGSTFGVAPAVSIVPVKVFPCNTTTTLANILEGIDWVVADHQPGQPAVANMSLSGTADSTLDAAVSALIADGITVAVAAGNANADACNSSPARLPAAVTVAASDSADVRASFSNFGSCVDLFAPGVGILSAYIGTNSATALMDGTSMASPHVAGAAALYLSGHPSATPSQVAAAIDANTTPGLPTARGTGDPAKLLYVDPVDLNASVTGSGSGTVTSPSGLSCAPTCATRLARGSTATLTASASVGSTFTGWSGGGCAGTGTCGAVVNGPTSISATFTLNTYALTVGKSGTGTGVVSSPSGVSCGATCSLTLAHGSSVTLSAAADAGSTFTGWSGGGCSGTGTCTVSMTSAVGITAGFALSPVVPPPTSVPPPTTVPPTTAPPSTAPAAPAPLPFSAFEAPVRLFDTRPGNVGALEQSVDETTRFAAGEVRRYVPGAAVGAPGGGVLAVNVTAVAPGGNGYLQVFPCASIGAAPPAASFLNYTAGITIANNGTVAIDASGGICVRSSQSANVIVDTTGYFPAGAFVALAEPARLLDSRPGQLGVLERPGGSVGGDIGVPLAPGVPWRFVVTGDNGIPTSAAALALNIAAVNPAGSGFLTVYPCDAVDTPPPASSTVNYGLGGTIANGAVIATAADGGICVLSSRSTHVIIDSTGHFPSGRFAPLATPVRLIDSRPGQVGTLERPQGTVGADITVPLAANTPWRFVVTGADGIPSLVAGVAINLVAVNPAGGGFITLYPCTSTSSLPPASSTVNYRPAGTIANGATVAPAGDGGICVLSSQTTNIIIDATGYFPA